EPNLMQRGVIVGNESPEVVEQKLDKMVEDSRVPDPFGRKDLPRPLRILRTDIVSFSWERKLNRLLIETKFDEIEFCFDRRYIGHAKEAAAAFRYDKAR